MKYKISPFIWVGTLQEFIDSSEANGWSVNKILECAQRDYVTVVFEREEVDAKKLIEHGEI